MNITLQTTDKLNGVVTAVVEPADYQENVKKAIKEFRKNADMPGFRKGMVPEGLIRKKYGKDAMFRGMDLEEVATTRERNHQVGGHKE